MSDLLLMRHRVCVNPFRAAVGCMTSEIGSHVSASDYKIGLELLVVDVVVEGQQHVPVRRRRLKRALCGK